MSTNFPTSLDSLSNPSGSDKQNSPSHSGQHSNANDAVEAIQAKVGVDSSAVTTSHDYKLSGVTGTDKAVSKTGIETLTDKTLTSPVLNTQATGTAIKDEDNMASDSATHLATQQSIKAYHDTYSIYNTSAKFRTGLSSDQTLTNAATWYTLEATSESYDPGEDYNTSTYYYTAPLAGFYLVYANISWKTTNVADQDLFYVKIDINDTTTLRSSFVQGKAAQIFTINISGVLSLTLNQTLRCQVHSADSAGTVLSGVAAQSYWGAHLLST